jgi:DNA invertase Pin-like site-specific DNA recombinase
MSQYIYDPPPTLPAGSVVIAYVRDSGGPNQEESRGQQHRVLMDYCKKHGLVLQHIYSETASGRRTKKRDQFLEMFNSIMTCPVEARPRALLLWAYSRFSRDVIDFNYFLNGILRQGVIVHSLTEQIPEGLTGQILLSFKAYKNADYSIELSNQIKRGIADRVTAGYNNGGTPPKGYLIVRECHDSRRSNGSTRIGVKWEVDPELAPLVKLAWELKAQGKGYGAITKATGGKLYKGAGSWITHFRNKSYLGIGKAGELEIPEHHEPLITRELWDAVKQVEQSSPRFGKSGKPFHPQRIKHPSLLSGLSFCIYCGSAIVLHTSPDYRSYACGSRDRQRVIKDCTQAHRIHAGKAEKVILGAVLNHILSPEYIDDLLAELQSQLSDTSKIDRKIDEVDHMLVITSRSINRFMKLAEKAGDLDEIAARLKELKSEESEHITHIRELKASRAINMPQLTRAALDLIFATWRNQIQSATENSDVLTVKKLLSQFVQKIELGYKSAIVHFTYPIEIPAIESVLVSAHKVLP